MRVLVTGAKGQLGYDVINVLNKRSEEHEYIGVDIEDFDITDQKAVNEHILDFRPDVVVHCSGYTQVDKAEDESDLCNKVNAKGAYCIALACKKIDAKMIYISTDYVFSGLGEKFYETTDKPNPLSVYGRTKLAGEIAVKELLKKYYIVRTSWMFGLNGNNFVTRMLSLGKIRAQVDVVNDQIGSPTYTADLAPVLCDLFTTEKYGTYHITNEGICSWAEFAIEVFRSANYPAKVNFITTEQYPAKARRPKSSRLSKKSLDENGFRRLPTWQDAVNRYINQLRKEGGWKL